MKKVVVTCDVCGVEIADDRPLDFCDEHLTTSDALKAAIVEAGVKLPKDPTKLPSIKAVKKDAFRATNETEYPTREITSIVRWVLRYLEVNQYRTMVKIKHHTGGHAYQGRFYSNPHAAGGYIYSNYWDGWKEVRPNVPRDMAHLIVARIGKPGAYPCMTHVYKRKDGPEPWRVETWQEALVSIMAHEGFHLRQHKVSGARNAGKYNEVDTEWAAYRLLQEWRKEL